MGLPELIAVMDRVAGVADDFGIGSQLAFHFRAELAEPPSPARPGPSSQSAVAAEAGYDQLAEINAGPNLHGKHE